MSTIKSRIKTIERIMPDPEPTTDKVTIQVRYPGHPVPMVVSISTAAWERMKYQLGVIYPETESQLPNDA